MLIEKQEIASIKENKVTLVKNFVSLEKNYDFNFLSQLLEEESNLQINQKSFNGNLKDVFQTQRVSNFFKEIKSSINFLGTLFCYEKNESDEIDLFFNFASQVGNTHMDEEDVFIIGLKGKVMYRVFGIEDKDYIIEKGDMVFIPKGLKHKVIALSPRITASVGLHGKRINE